MVISGYANTGNKLSIAFVKYFSKLIRQMKGILFIDFLINKLCVREILSLYFLCGAYFFEFRGRNLVCFVIAYNFNGKYAPEAGKTRMRTAFFTRASFSSVTRWDYSCLILNKICPSSSN